MQTLLLGIGVFAFGILLALLGMVIVRRKVSPAALKMDNEVAGPIYGNLGVAYAVLLAFVVVVVWEDFDRAESYVDDEANAITDLSRLAGGLAEPDRQQIRQTLVAYTRSVIDDEWDTMARGTAHPRTAELLDELWQAYPQVQPGSAQETVLHSESLRRMDDLSDARQLRLRESRTGLPAVLWVVLLGGSLVMVGFTYLFGVTSARTQAIMTAALAGWVALMLFLVYTLDYPFRGEVRVAPHSFESTLATLVRHIAGAPPGMGP